MKRARSIMTSPSRASLVYVIVIAAVTMRVLAVRSSPIVHKLRAPVGSRRSFASTSAFDIFKGFMGAASSTDTSTTDKGKNDSLLRWARQATMGTQLAPTTAGEGKELATFAGGCFWGLELQFQRVPGVTATSVGYTQGNTANPSYESVCSGMTGHTEAVQVTYDPSEVTFEQLLESWADKTDITTLNRQGNDRGTQYRSGVYYHTPEQKATAEKFFDRMREEIAAGKRRWAGREIAAEIKPAGDYYVAEGYHQQYLEKGGRMGNGQSAAKGCKDTIRCYG